MGSGGNLVSVIVPVYKVEDYLRQCLDSIINQTYKNLEIILVDDGSPDKCGEICGEYARNDSRITVYHKENGGLSDARNYGVSRSHGEYITFVDSDDVIKLNFAETLMGLIQKHDADIACAYFVSFNDSSEPEDRVKPHITRCMSAHDLLTESLYQRGTDLSACARIYRRAIWGDTEFPKGMFYEDTATTYKVIFRSTRAILTDGTAYYCRLRENSITKTVFSPKMLHAVPVSQQLFRDVTEKFPDLKRAASSKAFSMNRSVYLNFPFSKKNERMKLWAEMKKYRWTVIFDPEARKRERIAALLSYLGADLFHALFSWLYRKQQMMS